MTRVLLVAASTMERAPYVNIYTEFLDTYKVDYDIIIWNRCGDQLAIHDKRIIIFDKKVPSNIFGKLKTFVEYICFIRNHIGNNEYTNVILFTIPIIFSLYYTLIKNDISYICDIRDFSRVFKIPFIKALTKKAISNSDFTSISSEGFLEWLPTFDRYVISHNITREVLKLSKFEHRSPSKGNICNVLTIGQIRDYSANLKVVRHLSNNENIRLFFIGGGDVSDSLEHYVKDHKISNVTFEGRYLKSQELDIVDKYDMINIYFDRDINSRTLMSNRFYMGLLLKKPLIVASGTYQAKLVDKYSLGILVTDMCNMSEQILTYWNEYINNSGQFIESCNRLLADIKQDISKFDIQLKKHLMFDE